VVDNTSRTAKTEVQVSVQAGLNWGLGLVAGILIVALAGVVVVVNRSRRKPQPATQPRSALPPAPPGPRPAVASAAFYVFNRAAGGQPHPLTGSYVTVGRNSNNTIVLSAPDVSREHGVFELNRGAWTYRDLNVSTPSLYNGTDLYDSIQLNPGDILTLGSVELEFGRQ